MKSETIRRLAIGASLATVIGIAGAATLTSRPKITHQPRCPGSGNIGHTCGQGYHVENIQRPAIDGSLESWKNLYDSIDNGPVISVNEEEYDNVEGQDSKPGQDMYRQNNPEGYLKDPHLDQFKFLNRENPAMKDLFFIHYFNYYQRNHKK